MNDGRKIKKPRHPEAEAAFVMEADDRFHSIMASDPILVNRIPMPKDLSFSSSSAGKTGDMMS